MIAALREITGVELTFVRPSERREAAAAGHGDAVLPTDQLMPTERIVAQVTFALLSAHDDANNGSDARVDPEAFSDFAAEVGALDDEVPAAWRAAFATGLTLVPYISRARDLPTTRVPEGSHPWQISSSTRLTLKDAREGEADQLAPAATTTVVEVTPTLLRCECEFVVPAQPYEEAIVHIGTHIHNPTSLPSLGKRFFGTISRLVSVPATLKLALRSATLRVGCALIQARVENKFREDVTIVEATVDLLTTSLSLDVAELVRSGRSSGAATPDGFLLPVPLAQLDAAPVLMQQCAVVPVFTGYPFPVVLRPGETFSFVFRLTANDSGATGNWTTAQEQIIQAIRKDRMFSSVVVTHSVASVPGTTLWCTGRVQWAFTTMLPPLLSIGQDRRSVALVALAVVLRRLGVELWPDTPPPVGSSFSGGAIEAASGSSSTFLGWAATATSGQLLAAFCCSLGAFEVLTFLSRGVRFAVTQFVRPPLDLGDRYGRGSWAVVTGASSGIGLGFSVELARRGFNVCLVARNRERLERAAAEVHAANERCQTRVVTVDFRHCGTAKFWDHLHAELKDLDVSILVNNVGVNHTESFTTIAEQFLLDIVNVNCTSQMMLTRKLINHMVGRRHRSAVISVSSVAGQRPLLYLSPYSATKAFNDFFSRALQLEFHDKIDVLSLRPGYVVSNMSKLTEKGGFVLDRYECAKGCLDKLGHVTETYGDPRHAVYARSFFLLPEALLSRRRKQRLMEKNAAIARGAAQDGDDGTDVGYDAGGASYFSAQ